MQEEARNTETHHRLRDNGNLRSKAVTFVRAGELQRSEFENVDQDVVEDEKVTETEPQPHPQTECAIATEPIIEEVSAKKEEEPLFVLDSVGESVPDTGLSDPAPLADPDHSDDSSEDEVVFTGRNNKPIVIETDESDLRILQNLQEPTPQCAPVLQTEELTLLTQEPRPTPAQSRRKPPARERFKWSPDNDDILADYIANMDQDSESEEEEEENIKQVQVGPEGDIEVQGNDDETGVESSTEGKFPGLVHPIPRHNLT